MKLFRRNSPTKTTTAVGELPIIERRRWWYTISLSVLIPAVIGLVVFGLNLGIDFTGGSTLEIKGRASISQLQGIFEQAGAEDTKITQGENDKWIANYRIKEDGGAKQAELESQLEKEGITIERYDQIGPSVSRDLIKNALLSVGLMSAAVVAYISWAFRSAGGDIPAYRFGVATLVAAFAHDGLLVLGAFAILGRFFDVKFDSYIVTAVLTVIGFSIHDTVVVFDRVREKLSVGSAKAKLAQTINSSINETIVRSLNTSIVIILVLLALFLFGGPSIRYFVLALLMGMVAGTYSSIFVAAPLLVSWQKLSDKKIKS